MQFSLKFDLRAPAFGAAPADLYAAALDMCAWADTAGFDCARFLEHHGSDDGYCPSPLVMAAAAAARTRRMRIRVRALILPLHDPVRIAEDAAAAITSGDGQYPSSLPWCSRKRTESNPAVSAQAHISSAEA